MKKMKMEQITDLNDLSEIDCLLIIFKEDNDKGLTYKFIKDDFYVNLFNETLYIFDRSLELKGRLPMKYIDKFIKVKKE